jgi:hypothetical protein
MNYAAQVIVLCLPIVAMLWVLWHLWRAHG